MQKQALMQRGAANDFFESINISNIRRTYESDKNSRNGMHEMRKA